MLLVKARKLFAGRYTHARQYSVKIITSHRAKDIRLMELLHLNLMENLCSIIKRDLFENGRKYSRKEYLFEARKTAASNVKIDTVGNNKPLRI